MDGDYSLEIKRHLIFGRKAMANLDSILKSRDITLPTKVWLVKAMVFWVVMYGCESWTIKKAECRIDAFELWCWSKLLRVPWTERRSNQSILKKSVLVVHQVGDTIQPSHPLSPLSPPAANPHPQHQGLFQWVNSSHEVAKVLELQLQHQSFH